jgi:hypothetical protein
LHSPIVEGNVAVTMLQLSNIAWKFHRELRLDPANGHVLDDSQAMRMWNREYQKGWEVHV